MACWSMSRAALEVDAEWERAIRTRIHAGLFDNLSEENNQ
jgi:hypothetical protein